MKKILTLALALICVFSARAQFKGGSYRDIDDTETASAFKEHVGYLSSAMLEGRKAGSEGEKLAAAYVTEVLKKYDVDLFSGEEGDIFGMKTASGDTLTSRNVLGFIPGYDKTLREHYIVIGARLDNLGMSTVSVDGESVTRTFYGANGNASGLAMLLELARMLSTNKVLLKRSVIIAAFGSSLEMNAGSWYMLNRSFGAVSSIDAMINLDMLGTGSNGFYAYTSSNADLNGIITSLEETLQPVRPQIVGLEPVGSDHRSFYEKEIPSVLFTTGMYPEYNSDKDTPIIIQYDDMERELEYINNFTLRLANGPRPEFRATPSRRQVFGDRDVVPYADCDFKPSFLGSTDPVLFLKKWVYVYLKYPQEAVRQGIQGRVLVDFVIDEKGKVTDVSVARGVDPLLDEEAVKVIKASPDWKPARLAGKKVKCAMSLYVEFKLEKKKK